MTIASASEFRISVRRDAALDQVDDVGLGEHAALGGDVVQLRVVEAGCSTTSSGGRPTLSMHLSIVAPVPDAHLSFIEVMAVLSPVFSFFLNMMIFASWPPSSITTADVGVERLDRERDRVHLLDELRAEWRRERRPRPSR